MKRLLSVIATLLFALQYTNVFAQTEQQEMRVSVCVGEERLENLLTETQKDNVTHLTITGTMAEEDYAFIRRNRLKRITELNFRDADIDTIPPHAFDFKWVSEFDFYRVVVLPLSLKHIDDYGLCIKNIKEIVLTGKFPTLGESAYRSGDNYRIGLFVPSSDNEYLKRVDDCITSINDSVLYYSYFGSVPDGVHVIYSKVFEHIELCGITLPESIDSIGDRAFTNIHWMVPTGSSPGYGDNYIRFKSLLPPKLGTDVFLNLAFYVDVYVPEESFELYKNTEVWKDLNLRPYEEIKYGIDLQQANNSSLSVIKDSGGIVIKSSKKICGIKCFNLNGQLIHDMFVCDYEVRLNKNIINALSLVRVKYEDGTSETVKLKP